MKPALHRSPRPLAARIAPWVGLALLAPVVPPAAGEPALLGAVVDQIQRQCLRAYPAEMLAEMASGARRIPAQVEEDPKAQMQFLDKEVALEKGLFYPILLEDLLPAFERHVTPGSRFLDLGSGDGRAVFLARALGAEATGIEYDEQLVEVSRRALAALEGVVDGAGVRIVQDDFFAHPWSGYDVVYFFDQSSFAPDRVRAKLGRELDFGALLLVGHEQAPFPGLELVAGFPESGARYPLVRVYRRPAEAAEAPPGDGGPRP